MASYMIPRRVYAMVLCNCTLHTPCLAARYFLHSLAFEPGYFFAFTTFGTKIALDLCLYRSPHDTLEIRGLYALFDKSILELGVGRLRPSYSDLPGPVGRA